MDPFKNYIASLPQLVLFAICVAISVLVGIVDYFTGDYGITVAYILPIYVSAKLLGGRACICFTVICILALLGLAVLARQVTESFFDVSFWNAILQSAELGITGFLISRLTSKLCQPAQKY